jgi:DNA-binding IclR family transcriptional regulator
VATLPVDTTAFIQICQQLKPRQGQIFVRIHNAPGGLTRQELAEALLILKLGPVQYADLSHLQAVGLIEKQGDRYTVPPLVCQLVREVQQNQRMRKHLRPAPTKSAQSSPPIVQLTVMNR